jgi:hypothetical protein
LCSAYGWSYETAMRRTLPQIIMLNHSAWCEQKDADARVEKMQAEREQQRQQDEIDPFVPEFGKRLSEVSQNEQQLDAYLKDWSDFG